MSLTTATHLLFLVSFSTLALCILHLRRRDATNIARIQRLEDVLTRLTREELTAVARLSRVERTLKDTRARQDTLECRASTGPRIESAVRVARQGTATEDMLRDLGLSSAEASLLLRLHASKDDAPAPPDNVKAHDAAVQEEVRPPPLPRPGSQAASLSRLLAERAPLPA
ncbi:MAG: DUF2802 domain-containing protein [Pseudomonadota bacterium]